MSINQREIRKGTLAVNAYLDSLEEPFKEKFLSRKQIYILNQEAVKHLRETTDKYVIIVFSAKWCRDCAANVPVLALIAEAAGLEVRIFGGLKKDPLSHTRKWRIPPSPPEVETFNIDKIPVIIIANKKGEEIGRIIENPKAGHTLEEELYEVIASQR
jgi:thiol-disulfide isomerase/thioredoxin